MEVDLDTLLAVTTAYGAMVTKLVDALRNTFGKREGVDREWFKTNKWFWQACAFGIGVVIALVFEVNVVPGEEWLGTILTGLAIGAAGSGYHELFDALSSSAKSSKAAAVAVVPE